MSEDKQQFTELDMKMERLMDGINSIKDKQEEMAQDIAEIKTAVYDPDQGLYARIRSLEMWKESSAKIQWIVITTIVGLATATVWNVMVQ